MDCLEGLKDCPIPNLIIADPPYEFQSSGKGIVGMRELYTKIGEKELNKFDFNKFIPSLLDLQQDKVNAYFFCNKALVPLYLNEAIKRKLNYDILTLNKKAPIPCKNSSYLAEIEYVIFLRSKGAYWNGKLDYNYYFKSFFCFTNGVSNEHPTQKPIELIKRYIRLSSNCGDLILDPFMGSGTTAVACKQLERDYIGFELEKKYYDIAIKRLNQSNMNNWFTQKSVEQ